jgi:hypothetical protein
MGFLSCEIAAHFTPLSATDARHTGEAPAPTLDL